MNFQAAAFCASVLLSNNAILVPASWFAAPDGPLGSAATPMLNLSPTAFLLNW